MRYLNYIRATCVALVTALSATTAHADCFDDAAAYQRVNPWVLRAVADVESAFKANAVRKNSDGSIDRGMMQTNSVHLPELARWGVAPEDLMDGCKSVFVAAWNLRKKIDKHGNTCKAIGAYHSETPVKRDAYVEKIRLSLAKWSIPLRC